MSTFAIYLEEKMLKRAAVEELPSVLCTVMPGSAERDSAMPTMPCHAQAVLSSVLHTIPYSE